MIKMLRYAVAAGLVFTMITGCGKKEDNEQAAVVLSEQQQTVERKRTPEPQQKTAAAIARKQKNDSLKKDGRILTAEEQLQKYYAEKGIDYTPSAARREERKSVRAVEHSIDRSLPDVYREQIDLSATEVQAVQQSDPNAAQNAAAPAQAIQNEVENLSDQPEYSDSEPPELLSVQFEPPETQPGSKVTVVTQAVDNLSGINSIFGVLQNPSGTGDLSFHCGVLRDDGKFVGYVTIPPQAEGGNWIIKHMKLTDNVRNTKTYNSSMRLLQQAGLTVTSEDSDSIPPELLGVFIDPTNAGGGEKVQIVVDAKDEKSGIYRIIGVLVSPSRRAKISFSCKYFEEYTAFVGHAFIPNDAESGIWTIDYIRLEDNAKNKKTFYRRNFEDIFSDAQIDVHSSGSDSQPPEIQDILVYPPVVAYNEKLTIVISVYDDLSGVEQVSGRLRSPSGKAYIPFFCQNNPEEDAYTATIIIQKNTEVGLWNIDNVLTVDKAKNRGNYAARTTPQIQQAAFEVAGE